MSHDEEEREKILRKDKRREGTVTTSKTYLFFITENEPS